MTIAFTKSILPFGWMGNMAGGFPLVVDDLEYRSSEHLFQCLRFQCPEDFTPIPRIGVASLPERRAIQEEIRSAKNAFSAKLVTKKYPDKMVVQPCSEQDFANMRYCLRQKVLQHPDLKRQLLETGDELIVEDVTKRGGGGRNHVWGASLKDGEWVGQNILGKMWMELRTELKNGSSTQTETQTA